MEAERKERCFMLSRGAAKKVTIYVNEDTRYHMDSLWDAILRFLRHKQVAGATVLRPIAGFGVHEAIHSADQEIRSLHMPIRIEFIDTAEKVDHLLPSLYEMVVDGLIEVQDTNVIKAVEKGKEPVPHSPHAEISGAAKLIRIYLGEGEKTDDEPLFEAIVKRLMLMEVAGATVYRGILGYGEKRHTHRESRFNLSKDRPIMISVVDQPARVDEIIDAIAPMMRDGLIVLSDVEVHRFIHALPGQKVTNVPSTTS
jgi:PII-like signaling protein